MQKPEVFEIEYLGCRCRFFVTIKLCLMLKNLFLYVLLFFGYPYLWVGEEVILFNINFYRTEPVIFLSVVMLPESVINCFSLTKTFPFSEEIFTVKNSSKLISE